MWNCDLIPNSNPKAQTVHNVFLIIIQYATLVRSGKWQKYTQRHHTKLVSNGILFNFFSMRYRLGQKNCTFSSKLLGNRKLIFSQKIMKPPGDDKNWQKGTFVLWVTILIQGYQRFSVQLTLGGWGGGVLDFRLRRWSMQLFFEGMGGIYSFRENRKCTRLEIHIETQCLLNFNYITFRKWSWDRGRHWSKDRFEEYQHHTQRWSWTPELLQNWDRTD